MSQLFKKEIEKGLVAICNRIGFKKKQYYFIKPIDNNVIATLGFGMILHKAKGHIFIDVTIGVSHKNVEQLYAKLVGIDKPLLQSTIGKQIGYLMPEKSYKEWDFIENADNTYVYEDLLKNIQTYGFAYQEKMKDFDNLFEAIEKREQGVLNQARDRYLPILYYLKGDKQKGLKSIEEAIERQGKPVSDAEIKKTTSGETVILRAGNEKIGTQGFDDLLKKLPSGGSIVIVGSGIGEVDPEYLKFAERYKAL